MNGGSPNLTAMARPKQIPDSDVHRAILHLLCTEGDKSVSFSRVARLSGLAPATLVQRFGGMDAMMTAALCAGWDAAEAALTNVAHASHNSRGIRQILKSLPPNTGLLSASARDSALRQRATAWRRAVEAALAARLTGKTNAAQTAAILFAFWQGQSAWQNIGGKGPRLKDALKRLL